MIYKVEAIVREEVYEDLKDALNEVEVHGITVSQVMGCGMQKGYATNVRGTKVDINMRPKIKFEIVVSAEEWVEKVVNVISKVAYTGQIGDGKVFIYPLSDALRIRTGQRGADAIR